MRLCILYYSDSNLFVIAGSFILITFIVSQIEEAIIMCAFINKCYGYLIVGIETTSLIIVLKSVLSRSHHVSITRDIEESRCVGSLSVMDVFEREGYVTIGLVLQKSIRSLLD